MKAAVYRDSGAAADVLAVEDIERPAPGPGEVLVRVHASGINPTDFKTRGGMTARPIDGFQVPHHDGAGVIEAVGDGVDPARAGQRVWLWLAAFGRRYGTAAEWSVVPSRQAVPLPDSASFELGASLGVPAMTAHYCLLADGPLAGKTVLVAGGAGAVGHFAIELAKRHGARVIATVSSPEKAALASASGADLVVNYKEPDAADRIREFGAVDRVVEVALGANLELDLAVGHRGTVIVTYAAEPSNPELPVRACMSANVVLRFILLYGVAPSALDEAAADIGAALAEGQLTELPVHRYGLSDIVAAHEAAEAGRTGKIIVTP
ncbi:MAG TPA: NADPH:quinone reductase [Streptosporangiaceae bacterium]|nr:NADPH:quinone reductase [Streptosporangiaceae bacterium]